VVGSPRKRGSFFARPGFGPLAGKSDYAEKLPEWGGMAGGVGRSLRGALGKKKMFIWG